MGNTFSTSTSVISGSSFRARFLPCFRLFTPCSLLEAFRKKFNGSFVRLWHDSLDTTVLDSNIHCDYQRISLHNWYRDGRRRSGGTDGWLMESGSIVDVCAVIGAPMEGSERRGLSGGEETRGRASRKQVAMEGSGKEKRRI